MNTVNIVDQFLVMAIADKVAKRLQEYTMSTDSAVYKNAAGQLHREDGPAFVVKDSGIQYWCRNGVIHRDNGPAVVFNTDGVMLGYYFKSGKLHREDGPALMEYNPKSKKMYEQHWCLDGVEYTREAYYQNLYKRGLITDFTLFMELL